MKLTEHKRLKQKARREAYEKKRHILRNNTPKNERFGKSA